MRRTLAGIVGLVVAATVAAGCSATDEPAPVVPSSSPSSTPRSTSPGQEPARPTGTPQATAPSPALPEGSPTPAPEPAYSRWVLGAQVLPLRADGYGEVRRTPPSLRDRRYPTTDLLPPPAGGRDAAFASSIGPITPAIRTRMGETYEPGCPVGPEDLRYLTVSFRGFDGLAHTGELVVAATEARGVVSVFRALYAADFPIEEMRLPTTADLDAPPTGDGNNTGAFVCRPTTGSTTTLSAHAYGLALDLNPFNNPYQRGDLVLPELAGSYLDRSNRRPGMVYGDSVATREFARIGWSWGGDFQSLKDYQHYTATGR